MKDRCTHNKALVTGQYVRWKTQPKELEQLLHPELVSPDGVMPFAVTTYFRLGSAQAAAL